jgi:hypothetical protein
MIVLAGLGRVKAFRVSQDLMSSKPQIDLVYDCEFIDAHRRMVDRVTDQAGQFPVSGMAGASNGENHNLRGETERRLIRMVAEKINDLVHDERCWYLAAGEGINGRILDQLPPEVRSTLYKNIPSDLVKTPRQELLGHFVTFAG